MRRREFIAGFGAAAAWPLAARAQQRGGVRRIGVLMMGTENEPVPQVYSTALREGLRKLGWIDGRNLRLDVRFFRDDPDRMRAYAAELVKLAPDAIVVVGAAATRALQQQTRTIPIVFVAVGDPVASGIVGSIARPEGNTTGFTNLSPSVAGKWPELLKDAAPRIARLVSRFRSPVHSMPLRRGCEGRSV